MMSCKNSVCQIIKTFVTVGRLIALTCGCRVIKATLDDLYRLTRRARDAVWPSQFAHRLVTLHIINQIFDVDLQRRTPVMGWGMEYRQFTTSSHLRLWNPT